MKHDIRLAKVECFTTENGSKYISLRSCNGEMFYARYSRKGLAALKKLIGHTIEATIDYIDGCDLVTEVVCHAYC